MNNWLSDRVHNPAAGKTSSAPIQTAYARALFYPTETLLYYCEDQFTRMKIDLHIGRQIGRTSANWGGEDLCHPTRVGGRTLSASPHYTAGASAPHII
jgi:hypothetical protein